MNPDGTQAWPNDITPVDRVAQAMADVMRARGHVDSAMRELAQAVEKLVHAARGGHT